MSGRGKPCPYPVDPTWQNFCSLYREACTTDEVVTAVEKSHHMMAALYFGISAIEAFLNGQMRAHLRGTKSPEDVLKLLRSAKFRDKLKEWPIEITKQRSLVPAEALELITLCNDIRGDLTHPKVANHEIYEDLLEIGAADVVDAVAKYIVAFHQAQGTTYPYWVFGWNYLNPRTDTYEIIVLNEQQFQHSLSALGCRVRMQWPDYDEWMRMYMGGLEGYEAIRTALLGMDRCEPKWVRFPHQPKLCRRWWTTDHHKTCGHASPGAIAAARKLDGVVDRPLSPLTRLAMFLQSFGRVD